MTEFYDLDNGFVKKERPLPIRILNRFVSSPLCVIMLAVMTCLAFKFSREFEFYVFVIAYGTYVGLFNDDLAPLMPLFVFCYVAPSLSSNPGISSESVFYGKSGTFLIITVLIAVALIFVRIAKDENMGFKKLFGMKRFLTFGMLLLGASYTLSGILWDRYGEFAKRNLVFAALQFLAVFLLYFIFSATVDWDKFNVSYLVWIGVALGLIVAYEVLSIYISKGVFDTGSISRKIVQTGWGARNNVGAMLVLALPFPFYFAATKRFPAPWIIIGVAIFAFTVLTTSRTSVLCAVIALMISYAVLVFTARNKLGVFVTTAVLAILLLILSVRYFDKIVEFIKTLPEVFAEIDDDTVFKSNERVTLYKSGIDSIGIEPIFGITFYPTTYDIYEVATLESFTSFFPPRWHNTIIQILVSCGFVGLFAYLMHRISTVVLFIKRKNQVNVFIGISILSLLLMSLLDSHFFNIGPTLFYSIMLAVMEFGEE